MLLIFLVASVLNRLLISSVSSAQAEHERREGLFRFAHLSARTESEGMAFSEASKVKEASLKLHFDLISF